MATKQDEDELRRWSKVRSGGERERERSGERELGGGRTTRNAARECLKRAHRAKA
jgi:hypothetical protein